MTGVLELGQTLPLEQLTLYSALFLGTNLLMVTQTQEQAASKETSSQARLQAAKQGYKHTTNIIMTKKTYQAKF